MRDTRAWSVGALCRHVTQGARHVIQVFLCDRNMHGANSYNNDQSSPLESINIACHTNISSNQIN